MNTERLIKIYEEQLANINELLDFSLGKQKAIINNQREELEKFTNLEEQALSRINRKEKERSNCIDIIFSNEGKANLLSNGNNTEVILAELKSKLTEDKFKLFSDCRNEIKDKFNRIKEVNSQNLLLIEQANGIVKQTLNILLSTQDKPLLDRRI
jgi:hypothetical protein